MDKIASHLYDKYAETDYEKYSKLMGIYSKIKYDLGYLPKVIKSTYLCWRFPFLKFRNDKNKIFHTSCWYWLIDTYEGFTELTGWRKAFGIQLCKELKSALKRHGMLKTYTITDVKEKWGALNIYDDGAPDEVHDILCKYEYISSRTCAKCGRRAKYITKGYVLPFCEDCIKDSGTICQPLEYYKDYDWYGWKK